MSRIPQSVVREVRERAQEFCEACGGWLGDWNDAGVFHHRLPRSAGGKDEAANLMLVHGSLLQNCHNLTEYSIHQNPARSYRLGHSVRRGADPAAVPVTVEPELHLLRA